MGLDQYAQLRNKDGEEIQMVSQDFTWRKHARLQQFMAVQYAEQNPKDKDNDMNLGFNGGPVKLTKEIVDQLEEAVKNNYWDYFAHDGFFWGQQFQEESAKEYKELDEQFINWCRNQLLIGNQPEYYCSW